VRGTLPRPVLSTPRMISVMEYASVNAIKEDLEPGTATVGFEVCIKHVAAAPAGSTASLAEANSSSIARRSWWSSTRTTSST
jgi:predicted thioesterase